jgi:hypothetical protein
MCLHCVDRDIVTFTCTIYWRVWSEPVQMLYAAYVPSCHLSNKSLRHSVLCNVSYEHLQTAGTRILTLDEVPSVHIASGSDRHIGNIRVWLRHCISGNSQWSHWPCRVTSHSHLRQPGFNSVSSVKLHPMPFAHALFRLSRLQTARVLIRWTLDLAGNRRNNRDGGRKSKQQNKEI